MSFTPKILWDPHGILPPLSFFLLPPSLSPLSFPPSAFLFTLARAAAVVAVGTTVGNGGAVATVGRRRRSSDERASSPTGATVGTRLSPRESSVSSDPCRLSRSIERVSIIRAPCPSPSRRPAAVFAVGTLSLPREHRRRQPPRSSLRQPPPPSCLLPPPPRRRRPLRQSTPHPLLASATAANEGHRAPLVLLVRRRPFILAIGRTGGES